MDEDILQRLLRRHGRTFADEMGIELADDAEPLFQLLVGALLMSARIDAGIAMSAARVLFAHGCTTPAAMAAASWQERVDALGEGSYVRYDESTAGYLGETAELLIEEYDGDLRLLRSRAEGDPGRLRELLKECKGIGDVGVDIFFREAQAVWDELRPFADEMALESAQRLGLGSEPGELPELAPTGDLPRLLAALVRAELEDDHAVLRGEEDTPELTGTQLTTMSRSELYEEARRRDVSGRSDMTRDELAEALSGT